MKYEMEEVWITLKCQHCEFENINQATYCSGCGQLLEQIISSDVESQTFEKKNRWILVSVIGLLVLLLVSGMIWIAIRPDSVEVAKKAYQENDLAAYQVVQKKMSSQDQTEFDTYLEEEANAILESFKVDGIYYKEAIRKLERIKSYSSQSVEIQNIQDQVELLNQSREAYEQGKVWVEAKEWNNARECFESVVDFDPNYASAKRYLDSILRWQIQEIGSEASIYLEQGDYQKALESIEYGLELSPDSEVLLKLKQAVETAMNQPPVEEVVEEVIEEESPSLGEMIQSGLESLGDGIKSFFNGSLFGN